MEINIIDLAHLLLKKIWILILSALICAGLTLSYSLFFITPLYTSTARIYINNSSVNGYENKISSSDISAAESLVNNVVAIINSKTVINSVCEDLGRLYTEKQLQGMVSASVVTNTVMVDIQINCDDAENSQKVAQSFVKISQERIEQIIENSGVSIVDEPDLPEGQSSPSYKKFFIIGLLAGAVISAAIIILLDTLDTKIDSAADFETKFPDIPIIGIIPNTEEV